MSDELVIAFWLAWLVLSLFVFLYILIHSCLRARRRCSPIPWYDERINPQCAKCGELLSVHPYYGFDDAPEGVCAGYFLTEEGKTTKI